MTLLFKNVFFSPNVRVFVFLKSESEIFHFGKLEILLRKGYFSEKKRFHPSEEYIFQKNWSAENMEKMPVVAGHLI